MQGIKPNYEGPQVKLPSLRFALLFHFVILTLICVLLFQAVVRENHEKFLVIPPLLGGLGLSHLKLLDVNAGVTLLLAVVGLITARFEYAATHKPILQFSNLSEKVGDHIQKVVSLHNVGSGRAHIKSIRFQILCAKQLEDNTEFPYTFETLESKLKSFGLTDLSEANLARIADSASLPPEDKLQFISFNLESLAKKLEELNMRVVFMDSLGTQFYRDYRIFQHTRDWDVPGYRILPN